MKAHTKPSSIKRWRLTSKATSNIQHTCTHKIRKEINLKIYYSFIQMPHKCTSQSNNNHPTTDAPINMPTSPFYIFVMNGAAAPTTTACCNIYFSLWFLYMRSYCEYVTQVFYVNLTWINCSQRVTYSLIPFNICYGFQKTFTSNLYMKLSTQLNISKVIWLKECWKYSSFKLKRISFCTRIIKHNVKFNICAKFCGYSCLFLSASLTFPIYWQVLNRDRAHASRKVQLKNLSSM